MNQHAQHSHAPGEQPQPCRPNHLQPIVSLPWQSVDSYGMPGLTQQRTELKRGPYDYGLFPHATGRNQHILGPMESCVIKASIAAVLGGAMGVGFGIFFNGLENPYGQDPRVADLSTKDQIKYSWRQTMVKSKSMGKNFAAVGAVYSSVECVIEKSRGKHDINNALLAGAITGGVLAAKGGPQAALVGSAGFAVFSFAIEKWMESGHV